MMCACACATYVTCAWVAWAHVCPYHTCAILVGVMYIAWLICGGMCVSRLCLHGSYVCGWRRRGAGWWPWPMRFGWSGARVGAWICICMAGDGARSRCVRVFVAVLEVDGLLVYTMTTCACCARVRVSRMSRARG